MQTKKKYLGIQVLFSVFISFFTLIEIFNFDISFSGEFSRKVRILQ